MASSSTGQSMLGMPTQPNPRLWADRCQRQRIEGLFVEIHDMTREIYPGRSQKEADPECRPINVNGKRGRVVSFLQLHQEYIVHTFDGYWVCIPEGNLQIWPPPRPEDDGFDVCWPSKPDDMPMFGVELLSALSGDGVAVVQTIVSDRRRVEAMEKARCMTDWTLPKEELVQDFLGCSSGAKLAMCRVHARSTQNSSAAAHSMDPNRGAADMSAVNIDSFDRCCLELTCVFGLLQPVVLDNLGFECHSLTEELVWLPSEDCRGEQGPRRRSVTSTDVQCGDLEEHLAFLQRRRLCLLYLVCGAGSVRLCPEEELGRRPVTIPMVGSKLLVFRHDQMTATFTAEEDRPFLVIQAWTLMAPPQLEIKRVMGDPVSKCGIRGLKVGLLEPPGSQVNVNSILPKMPGNARGAARFWTMLLEGCDAQAQVPVHRFDADMYCIGHEDYLPGRSMTFHGGLCSHRNVHSFDNTIFGISLEEATYMATAQRIVLKCGLECLEMAGFHKDNLEDQLCGVFIGDTGSDWCPDLEKYSGWPSSEYEQQRFSNRTTAGRLAHTLGMKGPVLTLDTACSSSLAATDRAMIALRDSLPLRWQDPKLADTLHMALVMGISTITGLQWYVTLRDLMMLSTKGRCLSFDASGNGYARGEGCGAIYLNTGTFKVDRLAVIVGSATAQDGRSATLTAPNGPSQTRCIRDSLEAAAAKPDEVSVMECHGTGTPLGDPIEVGALSKVMSHRSTPLPCTAAKSHIGHLEAGAGLAGLIKSVVMLLHSSPTPSCHIHRINANLGQEGFPVLFETESLDTHLNSGLGGASSFGFGGTNAHADVWAECREGPRATGRFDTLGLDQIRVMCPISMEPIDHLTGEPAPASARGSYRADALRDPFAPYDVSSRVYSGRYRLRFGSDYEDIDGSLSPSTKLYIRGTWTAWQSMEEMHLQMDGWYHCIVVLGECRFELFHLCLDADKRREIYPAVRNASERTWACGPDNMRQGRSWVIDGRDEEVPAGTPYKIRFRWSKGQRLLIWDRAPHDVVKSMPAYHHVYSIVSSCTNWVPQDLKMSTKEAGTWECKLRLSRTGCELFQFVRNRDFNQAIYPAKPNTSMMSIPVRGPDELGHGKNFRVHGPAGDRLVIRLRIVDAQISVTVISDTKGIKAWHSEQGWNRRQYFLAGHFNGWTCTPMTMDPLRPGIFKALGCVGDNSAAARIGCLSEFQILIDEDFECAYYPELNGAGSGESIVCGPDRHGRGKYFLARATNLPSRIFEVALDLTSLDRRKKVAWTVLVDESDVADID